MRSPPAADRPAEAWLEERLGRVDAGGRLLVLCRSRATVSLVRRWAARRGGMLGVEAATPSGLAAQVHAPVEPLPDGAELPRDAAIGARIGERPGLVALAHRWTRAWRVRTRLGLPAEAPDWLQGLGESAFGRSEDDESLLSLVAAARARGRALSASARWDRVVALGFDEEALFLDPAETAVVDAMALGPRTVPEGSAGPLPSVDVPDVIAEARLAVAVALRDPGGTLILVGTDATARRVRDTLERNGLGAGMRDPTALTTHPLASAVRRAGAWFQGADPSLLAADLFFVLSRTALGHRLHPAAAAWLERQREPDAAEEARFDERALIAVLDRARLRDAPLSRWLARVGALASGPLPDDEHEPERVRWGARHLEVRLRILEACLGGRSLGEALPAPAGTPTWIPDDFEEALRELIGDLPSTVPSGDTLGALQRFLVELRVRVHDDPAARAILAVLRDRGHAPATPARIHEALSGPGLDPGVLSDGVDVLALDDWDGRPCRTLVVLDVHDHGLAKPIPRDPLLSDPEIRALGMPTGADRLAHRLRTLRRAAARAREVLLVVTRTDGAGRDTVPPIALDRVPAPAAHTGSYGGALPLPELRRTQRLAVCAAPTAAASPDPERRFLARAACLEWYLEGRHPVAEPPATPYPATLAGVLRAVGPTLPDALRPWLGHLEGVPEGRLPEAPHSVSRLLQPLGRCAWQAFAGVVLGVRERAELSDDLDPRELGQAAHRALQGAAARLDFRRHGDDDDLAAGAKALTEATDEAFGAILSRFGPLSAARTASADGQRDRWKRHWASWVRSRRRWPVLGRWELQSHPTVSAAELRFRELVPAARTLPGWQVRAWIVEHHADGPDLGPDALRRIDDRNVLPESTAPDLPTFLTDPTMAAVAAALDESRANRAFVQGAERFVRSYVAAEIPFGDVGAEGAPVHGLPGATLSLPTARLRFGSTDLELRGQIDRADWLVTEHRAGVVITDYKTGRTEVGGDEFRKGQLALEDPQLLVYAMVLARAEREGSLPPELAGRPVAVAHDRVRHTWRAKNTATRVPEQPDTWLPVDQRLLRFAAQELGHLVDGARSGRWPLRPHRHRCPKLARGAFCDVAAGCRLRGIPDGQP